MPPTHQKRATRISVERQVVVRTGRCPSGAVAGCHHHRHCAAMALVAVVLWSGAVATQAQEAMSETAGELLTPLPLPEQVEIDEGRVKVAGARLWFWDTGGVGPAVVLVHPGSGSGLVWGYQQPVFVKAGYRVIGYSRKNYVNSEIVVPEDVGSEVDDLHGLVQSLGLVKFHAVGLGAGGGIVMKYAVTHPKKLLSMTIACSLGSVSDEDYHKASAALRPKNFSDLPAEVRELGPCYRAANPEGVRRWLTLHKTSRSNQRFLTGPPSRIEVTWEKLNEDRIPTLLLGGDADLYMPPPMLKYFHDRVLGSSMVIVHGAGHAAHWEQPEAFNGAVLKFLTKHSG